MRVESLESESLRLRLVLAAATAMTMTVTTVTVISNSTTYTDTLIIDTLQTFCSRGPHAIEESMNEEITVALEEEQATRLDSDD